MALALVISSVAMVAFWILVLTGSDADTLVRVLFVIGLPSVLIPVYDYWRRRRPQR